MASILLPGRDQQLDFSSLQGPCPESLFSLVFPPRLISLGRRQGLGYLLLSKLPYCDCKDAFLESELALVDLSPF